MVSGAELLTVGCYEGVLRRCLTAVKQEGRKAVARELADLAAELAIARWGGGPSIRLHAVHSSLQGRRFRGFSLPQMVVRALLDKTDWTALESDLEAFFPTTVRSSQGLSLEERLGRHRQAPSLAPALAVSDRGGLLIVDDVVTSGATLCSSVAVARRLGFSRVVCLGLARVVEGD